jgi:hypothetical protein
MSNRVFAPEFYYPPPLCFHDRQCYEDKMHKYIYQISIYNTEFTDFSGRYRFDR